MNKNTEVLLKKETEQLLDNLFSGLMATSDKTLHKLYSEYAPTGLILETISEYMRHRNYNDLISILQSIISRDELVELLLHTSNILTLLDIYKNIFKEDYPNKDIFLNEPDTGK